LIQVDGGEGADPVASHKQDLSCPHK
jgi:hypothetical protein